jgi:ring-1,2-phenylacetyl-CoA epoxidase subunit PaaB
MSKETNDTQWPLWEVFVQLKTGNNFSHAGNIHAPDKEMALQIARDIYTRRSEGRSIWVVPTECIAATQSEDVESFFDPADDKAYRHPQFYHFPKGISM